MTVEITLSQLRANGFPDHAEFEKSVDSYIMAREVHSNTIGEARPAAHPLVEAVVMRYPPPPDLMPDENPQERFAAEYEFRDDTPPPAPPPSLDQRRGALAQRVAEMSMIASVSAWPPLTRRLLEIRGNAASMIDPADRTPEQIQAVADVAEKRQKLEAINLHLAELEVEIHNLTEADIDAWQPSAFPA